MTLVIAHRTCPANAPENSLRGIRFASSQGADGVEVDVHLSLDQKAFLLHDWTLSRTTGFPLPMELTPSFLVRQLRLEGGSEPVPSLAEAFAEASGDMLLAIDVKNPLAARHLVAEAKSKAMENRTLAWCTSARSVRYLVKSAPSIETAYLRNDTKPEDTRKFIDAADRLGAAAISAHWLAIEKDFVAAAHSRGLRVYSYHSSYELTDDKLSSGLDGLITDYPAEARRALDALT